MGEHPNHKERVRREIDHTAEDSATKQEAKEVVDLRYHVNQRPWAMFGASVLAGLVLARIL